MNYQYVIDKEACRESFEKFPPKKQKLIKKMAAELEKLLAESEEKHRCPEQPT